MIKRKLSKKEINELKNTLKNMEDKFDRIIKKSNLIETHLAIHSIKDTLKKGYVYEFKGSHVFEMFKSKKVR